MPDSPKTDIASFGLIYLPAGKKKSEITASVFINCFLIAGPFILRPLQFILCLHLTFLTLDSSAIWNFYRMHNIGQQMSVEKKMGGSSF